MSLRRWEDRFLFEMATRTGKTLTASAVIKPFVRTGHARRVLFLVDRYFAQLAERFQAGFDPGRSLPADDADLRPPRGAFLLASVDGEPVGCGAVKAIAPGVGSLKRVWVADSVRGLGFGRRMLGALESQARDLGLTMLRLETNRALAEAIRLYRSAGYVEVAPFNADPYADHWFEKRLA